MLTQKGIPWQEFQSLDFRPFTVKPLAAEGKRAGRLSTYDLLLEVTWQELSLNFVVEYKAERGLASLRGAIARAKAAAFSTPGFDPMVIQPYLSREALDELVEAGVSGLDLCGNGVLYVPGRCFAYKTGVANKYPDSAPIVSPFRGNQSIVARAFLTQPTFDKQKDLVSYLSDSGIAPSTVSKMLVALEQNLLITRTPNIRLVRAEALLDKLREDYTPPVARYSEKVRLLQSEAAWTQINTNASERGMRYAISNPERYTVLPRSTSGLKVFTDNLKMFLEGVEYSLDERFPTIELIETDSRVPFFDKRFTIDRWWTSPIQEYLDLANGGKREADAAIVVRTAILKALDVQTADQ